MINYTAKSSIVSTSEAVTQIAPANRDRKHLEVNRGGFAVYVGDVNVTAASGYISNEPIRLTGEAATGAIYGIMGPGSTGSVYVLEVIPDLS